MNQINALKRRIWSNVPISLKMKPINRLAISHRSTPYTKVIYHDKKPIHEKQAGHSTSTVLISW